jgi:hypothetical protein
MPLDAFDVLIGLRLSIVRRAADMLVLHFGDIRPHSSGTGTVGAYALHVQCPWRLDGPAETVIGSGDLWDYAGPGERPEGWSYDDGLSLQDKRFAGLFARDEETRSWINHSDRFVVVAAQQTKRGEIKLDFVNRLAVLLFPASSASEAWRLFAPGSDRHLVFPTKATDAPSRRKQARATSEWEIWLKLVDAPDAGRALQAPPTIILAADGPRYRCGSCGTVLAIAEIGALKGFAVHCGVCGRYNEASV